MSRMIDGRTNEYSSSASKAKERIKRLTCKYEAKQMKLASYRVPCVRTQLAIATAKERIKRLTSKYEAKQMKLASYHLRIKRLTSKQLDIQGKNEVINLCLLYTSPSPRDS